ncbi:hypothetical protein EYW44_16580 [Tenacibaculum sp. M341]|nr:hypothetical protein EYW44_16580 [Tenacibaculum sp. M341]
MSLVSHVKNLPYGRNENREDLSLVIKEGKGSCSSKHAFLCEVARENAIDNIQLVLGVYKMTSANTNILHTEENFGLPYIPEAHCYLKINAERVDVTSETASFFNLKDAILYEEIILPSQVAAYKVDFHKKFIKNWVKEERITKTFEEVWSAREACIRYLSES